MYLITILGVATIFSFYWVFRRVFDERVGLVASLIYATSFYTVMNDREVVPTMPVILWSVWFFYSLNLILKGDGKKGFILVGLLTGLIWHLNFALVLLVPLIAIAVWLAKNKPKPIEYLRGLVVFGVASLPLIVFELRHGFLQTRAVYESLVTGQGGVAQGLGKLSRVVLLASRNVTSLTWGPSGMADEAALALLVFVFLGLAGKKMINKNLSVIMSTWVLMFIAFFSFYSKVVSEYYLNATIVVWVAILAVAISGLFKQKRIWAGALLLFAFGAFNIYRLLTVSINESGYIERKELVSFIKSDAAKHEYPCVSVSYITDPGYNMGYRYLFYLAGLHVNLPKSNAPVYTIVFPHSKVSRIDRSFGALGLIFPDYERYTKEAIAKSCEGENQNLTEPMILFTK